MSDVAGGSSSGRTGLKYFRLLPLVVGAILSIWLIVPAFLQGTEVSLGETLRLLAMCGVILAVVAILRFALGAIGKPPSAPPSADANDLLRTRLAPMVINVGTAGMLIIAVAVLCTMYATTGGKVEPATLMGIFSSVVPVFATWVGAVIAFYFSNESFKQAAQSTNLLMGDTVAKETIDSPARMIPYDKITKLVLEEPAPSALTEQFSATEGRLPATADEIPMEAVRALFGDTISRVIVFDARKWPLLVLRKKLDLAEFGTVADYLRANGADAKNFRAIVATATVPEARALMTYFKVADLFVAEHGAVDEPAKGWVPDDKLA